MQGPGISHGSGADAGHELPSIPHCLFSLRIGRKVFRLRGAEGGGED